MSFINYIDLLYNNELYEQFSIPTESKENPLIQKLDGNVNQAREKRVKDISQVQHFANRILADTYTVCG